jgi:DNA-directed RNA polymerase subunit alpha
MLASKGLYLGMAADEREPRQAIPQPAALTRPPSARSGAEAMPLGDVELSARSRKALDRLGVESVGELSQLTEEKLLGCKNFGETSLNEVKQVLRRFGLTLSG